MSTSPNLGIFLLLFLSCERCLGLPRKAEVPQKMEGVPRKETCRCGLDAVLCSRPAVPVDGPAVLPVPATLWGTKLTLWDSKHIASIRYHHLGSVFRCPELRRHLEMRFS